MVEALEQRPSFGEALWAEWLIAKQAFAAVDEDNGIIPMVIANYLISAPYLLAGFKDGHVYRSAYYPVRSMDDWLDLGSIENPMNVVMDIRYQIETKQVESKYDEVKLINHSLRYLEANIQGEDNPRADFLQIMDMMMFDYLRMQERRVLSANDIEEYYWKTFSPVLNIFLMSIESDLRANDVEVLVYGQGWVYSARDLVVEDWPNGIINIDGETLESAGLSDNSNAVDVWNHPTIRRRFMDVFESRIRPQLLELDQRLLAGNEPRTRRIMKLGLIDPLVGRMNRYSEEFT